MAKSNKQYISYDYMELKASKKNVSWLIDGYKNFGWELDHNISENIPHTHHTIPLKRARSILNKAELTRLQQHFQSVFDECETLENRKHLNASIASILVGLLGTLLVTISVFFITLFNDGLIICLCWGIPGIILCILPLFIYPFVLQQQNKKINPLIERKKEEMDQICEKGMRLL